MGANPPQWVIREGTPREAMGDARAARIPHTPRLWWVGELHPQRRWIAVVGARRHSAYGARVCRELVYGLAGTPVVVVSGLAYGIDALAHRAALEVGVPTVGVPGSGLAFGALYPSAHRTLAAAIVQRGGGLWSPFAPQERAARWTFPARNRLIAALVDAVVVIEARHPSGTLITANAAATVGTPVGVVPHRWGDPLGEGPHALLRDGATLIRHADDVLELVGLSRSPPLPDASDAHCSTAAGKGQGSLVRVLKERGALTFDELVAATQLPISEVLSLITTLELQGIVQEDEEGRYHLLR